MVKIFNIISVIICLCILSGCCSKGIDIRVKKDMTVNLNKYHLATIVVQDYKYGNDEKKSNQDVRSSSSRIYIDIELFKLLREKGLEVTYGDKDPVDLKVECYFQRRIGCIDIGRHFNIECRHTSLVNLKFIDVKTKKIIGEVECERPSYKRMPPTYIKLMFDELMRGPRKGIERKTGDSAR